jgi:hypothetical protein
VAFCLQCGSEVSGSACARCGTAAPGSAPPAVPPSFLAPPPREPPADRSWSPAPASTAAPTAPPAADGPALPPLLPVSPGAPGAPPGWYTVDGQVHWWDGYRWSAAPPEGPRKPFRRVLVLGRWVQASIGVVCVAVVVDLVAGVHQYRLVERVRVDPVSVSYADLEGSDDLVALTGLARIGLMVLAAIVFLVWLHRVFRNLHDVLGTRGLDHSPAWAVGWWFVPFANLWKPKQVLTEAWRASGPEVPAFSAVWERSRSTPLVAWWWAAFLIANVLYRISNSMARGDELSLGTLSSSIKVGLVGDALVLGAGILLVVIVGQVATRLTARASAAGVSAD